MEVLVVSGMITVLAGIAVPRYSAMALQMRTSAAATQLQGNLHFARVMAQRTGAHHYVNVSGATGIDYEVQRAAFPPNIDPDNDPVIRNVDPALTGVEFDLNGAGTDPFGNTVTTAVPASAMVFDPRGLPFQTGSFFVASEDGNSAYAISITGAGRVRMWRQGDSGWH